MMRLIIGVAAGYVLGARAGRARYEQISKMAQAVLASPITARLLLAGRQLLSDTLTTTPRLEPMPAQEDGTTVLVPRDQLRH